MEYQAKCDVVLPGPLYVKSGTVMEFVKSPGRHWQAIGVVPEPEPERPRRGRPPTVVAE